MTDEIKTEQQTQATVTKAEPASLNSLIERLAGIVDKSVQNTDTKIATLEASVSKMEKSIAEITAKAMQTPTDFPLKPAAQADEDIGAKVEAPDTYQSNSVQNGITEEGHENTSDGEGLRMQKSTVTKSAPRNITTTGAPRPSANTTRGQESFSGIQPNALLKAARDQGFAGLEQIARDIKKGVYGRPQEAVY